MSLVLAKRGMCYYYYYYYYYYIFTMWQLRLYLQNRYQEGVLPGCSTSTDKSGG
jgi:hypothetical protein